MTDTELIADVIAEEVHDATAALVTKNAALEARLSSAEATIARQTELLDIAQRTIFRLDALHLHERLEAVEQRAAAPGPPGEKGERGDPGDIGVAGRDGVDGKDGRDGKDARDVSNCYLTPEGELVLAFSDGTEKGVGTVIGPAGKDGIAGPVGPAGEKGLDGLRGEKGDSGAIGPQGERGLEGATGPVGPQGEKGSDGLRGEKGDPGDIGPRGDAGADGQKGDPGERGLQGEPGRDGRDGQPGVAGPAGEKGLDGKDGLHGKDGRDGVDGLGFDDFSVEYDPVEDPATFSLKFTKGDREKTFGPFRVPRITYRNVFEAGKEYSEGDAVTYAGSLWIARAVTKATPGAGATPWQLAVKKGADGREGKPGTAGKEGPKGPKGDPGGLLRS
jgi:collagen type III alpha